MSDKLETREDGLHVDGVDCLPTRPFLTLADIREATQLGKTKLYEMIRDGEFPAPVHFGRAVRWRRGDVLRWVASLGDGPTSPEVGAA